MTLYFNNRSRTLKTYIKVILREKTETMIFENEVLTKIFGLKRDDLVGNWRQLYSEELHRFYL